MNDTFILYLQHVTKDHILSDKAFALLMDGDREEQRQHAEMLRYEAVERHQLPAGEVEGWLRETGRRYREDPELFRVKALSNKPDPAGETAEELLAEQRPHLETVTAADLQKADLPPVTWIVRDLLPAGLAMIASPPKYGKSWLALDLCISAAFGRKFLGYGVNRCGALYLALEDSQRRLKSRMGKLLGGKTAPPGLHVAVSASTLDGSLMEELEVFLTQHPETALIVIDTLQKIRGAAKRQEGVYAVDYRESGVLKAFADQHNICVLLVHHLRKMQDTADPFNMISGSNGLLGSADTTLVLTRKERSDPTTVLHIVGRDVESATTVLRFDRDACRWENMGDEDWYAQQQARLNYQASPLVKTILKLAKQRPEGWTGTAQELMNAGRLIARTALASTPRELVNKIKPLVPLLFNFDGVAYERKRNGSGGGKHRFYIPQEVEEVPQLEELEELEQTELPPFDNQPL